MTNQACLIIFKEVKEHELKRVANEFKVPCKANTNLCYRSTPYFSEFLPHFFFLFRAKFHMLNDADKSPTCNPLVLPGRLCVIRVSFARNTVKIHAADFQDVQQKNMFPRATVTFFCFRTSRLLYHLLDSVWNGIVMYTKCKLKSKKPTH